MIITSELFVRPTRNEAHNELTYALEKLTRELSASEQELLDALVRAILELCEAGTAGFSAQYEDEQIFPWDALAGEPSQSKEEQLLETGVPGTTLDLGKSQLFSNPSRCFDYFKHATSPVNEGQEGCNGW